MRKGNRRCRIPTSASAAEPVSRQVGHFWTRRAYGGQRGYLRDCGNSIGRAAKAWGYEDPAWRIALPESLRGARRPRPRPPPPLPVSPSGIPLEVDALLSQHPLHLRYAGAGHGRYSGMFRVRKMTSYRGGRRAAPPATPIATHTASDLDCRPGMRPSFGIRRSCAAMLWRAWPSPNRGVVLRGAALFAVRHRPGWLASARSAHPTGLGGLAMGRGHKRVSRTPVRRAGQSGVGSPNQRTVKN